jgi:hypothetical protein
MSTKMELFGSILVMEACIAASPLLNLAAEQLEAHARLEQELGLLKQKNTLLEGDLSGVRCALAETYEQSEFVNAFRRNGADIADRVNKLSEIAIQMADTLKSPTVIKTLSMVPREYANSDEGRDFVKIIQASCSTAAKLQKQLGVISSDTSALWKSISLSHLGAEKVGSNSSNTASTRCKRVSSRAKTSA